jgi:Mg-chelatase subunit ChlD
MSNLSNNPKLSTLNSILGKSQTAQQSIFTSNQKLDIALSFDTTGSMYSYLQEVRKQLDYLSKEIKQSVSKAKIGVVAFGDYCDAQTTYVTKVLNLSDDYQQISNFIRQIKETHGGDAPEAVEEALFQANQLSWRLGSSRAMVLVGDAPPHGVIDSVQNAKYGHNWQDETQSLGKKGIKIYTVQCGNDQNTKRVFQEIAKSTNGLYLNLENMSDLVDLLISICMKEVGLLGQYEQKLRANNSLNPSKQKLLKQLNSAKD